MKNTGRTTENSRGGGALMRLLCPCIALILSMLLCSCANNGAPEITGAGTEAKTETTTPVLTETDTEPAAQSTADESTAEEPDDPNFPLTLINGISLRKYKLVTDRSGKNVEAFISAVQSVCGHAPELVATKDYKGGPAFFLGTDPNSGGKHVNRTLDSYSYYVDVKDNKIAIDYNSKESEKAFTEDFLARYITVGAGKDVSVTIPEGVTPHYSLSGQHNVLRAVGSSAAMLADGIWYLEIRYTSFDNTPVNVFALEISPGAGRFYAGLPGDADSESASVSTVLNTVKTVNSNTKKVVAGTNGGFFDMNGTHLSRGTVIKEGKTVQLESARPVFAQFKDGSLAILTAAECAANASKINTAVAGSIIMLKDGTVNNVAPTTDSASLREPRTAVGLRPDGTCVLFVVDGRRPALSNGATYLDLVTVGRDLGCTELLNLDGGGSSTMVIKDPSSGAFTLKNSPSGTSMRQVQDCLLILLP